MTPQEQIAYLRNNVHQHWNDGEMLTTILAVCDLAERALLTDEDCNAIRDDLAGRCGSAMTPRSRAVLRRLLPDERVEHRLVNITQPVHQDRPGAWWVLCSCGEDMSGDTLHDSIALGAAHAGIGGTE